jgi:hypothetical protein
MKNFEVGSMVEVIKKGYAIERGRQGKVIDITQDDTYRYCVIQAGDIVGAVPDRYIMEYVPGDDPRLSELLDNLEFPIDNEESRNFFRVLKYITNEGPYSDELIAAVMYGYGKTQGIKEARRKAKERAAHSEE